MAFPLAAAIGGIGALGSLLGLFGKRKKPMSPEELRSLFGPEALNKDTMDLFNMILTSPYGQRQIEQAQSAGGRISQNISARLAKAGMAGGGAESGVGSFAAAAGQEAGNEGAANVKSQLFSEAMNAAIQNLSQRMGLAAQGRAAEAGQPTRLEQVGGAIAGAAGNALSMLPSKAPADVAPAGGRASYVPSSFNPSTGTISLLPENPMSKFALKPRGLSSSFDRLAYVRPQGRF